MNNMEKPSMEIDVLSFIKEVMDEEVFNYFHGPVFWDFGFII